MYMYINFPAQDIFIELLSAVLHLTHLFPYFEPSPHPHPILATPVVGYLQSGQLGHVGEGMVRQHGDLVHAQIPGRRKQMEHGLDTKQSSSFVRKSENYCLKSFSNIYENR